MVFRAGNPAKTSRNHRGFDLTGLELWKPDSDPFHDEFPFFFFTFALPLSAMVFLYLYMFDIL